MGGKSNKKKDLVSHGDKTMAQSFKSSLKYGCIGGITLGAAAFYLDREITNSFEIFDNNSTAVHYAFIGFFSMIGFGAGSYLGVKIREEEITDKPYIRYIENASNQLIEDIIVDLKEHFKFKTKRDILSLSGRSDSDFIPNGALYGTEFFEPKDAFLKLNYLFPKRKRIVVTITSSENGNATICSYDEKILPRKDLEEIIKNTINQSESIL